MKPITCLLIEDEKLSRDELRYLLEPYAYIEVIGEASSGLEGYELIKTLRPDLIFLDISMPGMSGIELAGKLSYLAHRPQIVFTTAHQDHAVKAFELGAIDYLLKPYDERRFHATMERIRQHFVLQHTHTRPGTPLTPEPKPTRLAVQLDDKTLLIDMSQILYCSAENDRILVHTLQGDYDTSCTLQELIEKTHLFRIHRSYAVNLSHIAELYPWFNGTYQVCLSDPAHTPLTVSRSYVKALKKVFQL